MTTATDRPFTRPHYGGGSIANLMAGIERAIGASPAAVHLEPGPCPSEALLHDARHVVMLVIDGMGTHQLMTHAPDGALAGARCADLTSVFPSTTASAVSTYLTGDTPLTHGLTGWHMWFRELGEVATPLPFRSRGANTPLEDLGVDAARLFATRAFPARLARRTVILHPDYLCGTRFTEAHRGGATVQGFGSLDELGAGIVRLAQQNEPSYCYAYWPTFDGLSHQRGWASRDAAVHLRAVDRMVETCARALAGTGTVLLVSADHGFVDTRPETRLQLASFPAVAATLARPLCGEPRLVYCYVKPGAGADFEGAVDEALGDAVELRTARAVLDDGLLGLGPVHPEIEHRIGTHVLFMRDEYCLVDRLPGEDPFTLVGVHGGMSDSELRVPLCVFHDAG